jgi:hypothetical protein
MAKNNQRNNQSWWGYTGRSKDEEDEHREDEDSFIDYLNK